MVSLGERIEGFLSAVRTNTSAIEASRTLPRTVLMRIENSPRIPRRPLNAYGAFENGRVAPCPAPMRLYIPYSITVDGNDGIIRRSDESQALPFFEVGAAKMVS